jgi:hypothetical protein
VSRIAVDFDGTLVTSTWPDVGVPMKGAAEAVKAMQEAGHTVFVYTARVSPYFTNGTEKTPAQVFENHHQVREALDAMGLNDVDIWMGKGKPHFHLLIDDRAMRFPGRPGSWSKIVPAILARV